MKRTLLQSGALFILMGLFTVRADQASIFFNLNSVELIKITEVVIAGVVASAIILAILALFMGQWAGKRQEKVIKKIRENIEEDEKIIKASVLSADENTVKIQQLLIHLEKKSSAITSKQHQAWIHVEDLEEMVEDANECSEELYQTTDDLNHRMKQVQAYWDEQLDDTAEVVKQVQSTLKQGIGKVRQGIEELQQNEIKTKRVSQKIMKAYQQQSETLIENATLSEVTRTNLQKAFKESEYFLSQLDQHRERAKKSFQTFNHELSDYHQQAYERFDNASQTNDIAQQELTAYINESRLHIDNLRRYETEGRNIKLQAHNHLESMNSKSIQQFETTLKNTQQMFSVLQHNVQDAQVIIETLQNQTQIIDKNNSKPRRELQAVSGDSTLVPFFSAAKK